MIPRSLEAPRGSFLHAAALDATVLNDKHWCGGQLTWADID